MEIKKENNKIYFNYEKRSYGIITFNNNAVTIELIKVLPPYRQTRLASQLLSYILKYISDNFIRITKVILNPLPLDINGLKLNELIEFYKRYGFTKSSNGGISYPHLMVKYI